jgi:hypothetical protein
MLAALPPIDAGMEDVTDSEQVDADMSASDEEKANNGIPHSEQQVGAHQCIWMGCQTFNLS